MTTPTPPASVETATPRTDEFLKGCQDWQDKHWVNHARQLERELSAARRDGEMAYAHLMNLQPHIAQLPESYRGFIDPHVDMAMKAINPPAQ
jgi:hypothetical protein